MEEVLRGRCRDLGLQAHQCSQDVDAAKSTLALVRPSTEHVRRATREGA